MNVALQPPQEPAACPKSLYWCKEKQVTLQIELLLAAGMLEEMGIAAAVPSRERVEWLLDALVRHALVEVYRTVLTYDHTAHYVNTMSRETIRCLLLRYFDHGTVHLDLAEGRPRC